MVKINTSTLLVVGVKYGETPEGHFTEAGQVIVEPTPLVKNKVKLYGLPPEGILVNVRDVIDWLKETRKTFPAAQFKLKTPAEIPTVVLVSLMPVSFGVVSVGDPVQFVMVPLDGVPNAPPTDTKSVPAVAAEIAVPSPLSIPVMLVEIVIAGVLVAVATVPAKPLADTTLAVVTVPEPPPPAGAVLCQVVPLLVRTLPEVLGATKVGLLVPLPRMTLFAVSVASPVPPEATASVALKPAAVPVILPEGIA